MLDSFANRVLRLKILLMSMLTYQTILMGHVQSAISVRAAQKLRHSALVIKLEQLKVPNLILTVKLAQLDFIASLGFHQEFHAHLDTIVSLDLHNQPNAL